MMKIVLVMMVMLMLMLTWIIYTILHTRLFRSFVPKSHWWMFEYISIIDEMIHFSLLTRSLTDAASHPIFLANSMVRKNQRFRVFVMTIFTLN